jgi:hypothetical protein
MKKLFALVMSALCFITLSAQKTFLIGGKVVDSASQQPLAGASVFAQNTTQGTTSDYNGVFIMRLPNGGYDLIISYTGYETRSIRISNTQRQGDSIVIALPQVSKTLEEVAVVATNEVEDGWTQFGKFFFDNFIGTTPNASLCTIQNPQVLRFFYTKNKKRHRLKVTAREELMIQNDALGYIIRYQLDSFSYDYNSNISQYTGYPFFIDKDTTPEVKEQWAKNRARTYLGSRLHFMTSLYDSILTDEGFVVEKMDANLKSPKGDEITNLYDSTIYRLDSNTVEIDWDGHYRVSYKNVLPDKKFLEEFKLPSNTRAQVTLLDISGGFFIEENGYFFEQYDVVNTGYWAWKKIAESLPYDYVYE